MFPKPYRSKIQKTRKKTIAFEKDRLSDLGTSKRFQSRQVAQAPPPAMVALLDLGPLEVVEARQVRGMEKVAVDEGGKLHLKKPFQSHLYQRYILRLWRYQ